MGKGRELNTLGIIIDTLGFYDRTLGVPPIIITLDIYTFRLDSTSKWLS
jgi:hypothetical protein